MHAHSDKTARLSLSLDPVLDLRSAETLQSTLLQGLEQRAALAIDASAVARVSTACAQVFTAFVLAARRSGTPVILKKSSPAFDAAFAGLGLDETLNSIKPQGLP